MTLQEFTDKWAQTVKEQPDRFQAEYDAEGNIVAVLDADSGTLYLPEGWVA